MSGDHDSAKLTDASNDGEALRSFYKDSEDYAAYLGSKGDEGYRGAVEVLRPWLEGTKIVLDVGCGCAQTTELLSKFCDLAVGTDLSFRLLHEGRSRGLCTAPLAAGDVTRLPFRTGSVDAVTSFEMIEHVPDIGAALKEIARVLKQGGLLFIHAPNATSIFDSVKDVRNLKQGRKGRNWLAETLPQARLRMWQNVKITLGKLLRPGVHFLYIRPDLGTEDFVGGDRDMVYYSSPVDIARYLRRLGFKSVMPYKVRSPRQRAMSALSAGSGFKASVITRLTWPFEGGIQILAIK